MTGTANNNNNNDDNGERDLDAENLVAAAAAAMVSAVEEGRDSVDHEMLDPDLMKKSGEDGHESKNQDDENNVSLNDDHEDDINQMNQIEEADEEDEREQDVRLKRAGTQKVPNSNYIANLETVVNVVELQAMNNKNNEAKSDEIEQIKNKGHDMSRLNAPLTTGGVNQATNVGEHGEKSKENIVTTKVSKPLSSTRRAAQNRAAQKAFRERRKKKMEDLERVNILYKDALQQLEVLRAENLRLMKRLAE